ncbi:hypothetical protein T05_15567 [Trichinella murrelli]|uniref:Uncharacterized protein n=1 Tax=Trichinella murrelli TaxID=144512 RepID=A0A0V0UIU2_9BILA|nr:hypothetical protein T05_15567 [Trichinella murrelli]
MKNVGLARANLLFQNEAVIKLGEESPGVRVTPARFPSKLRFASSFVIVLFQQAGREVVFAIQYSSASSLNH